MGWGSPRHLTVISTLSVDCYPPSPAPQAPHTSPFTLNVTHSVAQHGHASGSLLPYLSASLPARNHHHDHKGVSLPQSSTLPPEAEP